MNRTCTGTDSPLEDAQVMLKAIKFANLINESALHYRNWKDAEKALEQATDEYNRGKPQFRSFPVLKERLEEKKSTAEKVLLKTKATHDIKAKILTDCCKDLLSDRLSIREIEDLVVTAREVIRGRDLQIYEQRLLDQCKTYLNTVQTRERSASQVDLSEIYTELQHLRAITERQDTTIKEQQDSIVKMITQHNSEIDLLRKEVQEASSSSRSQIATIIGMVQGVKIEMQQQETTTYERLLKVASSVEGKMEKFVADMQGLRVICDGLAGFDKASYELQTTEMNQSINGLREITQSHTEALLQAEKVLNEYQGYFNNGSSSQEESRNMPLSQSVPEVPSLSGFDYSTSQDPVARVSKIEEKQSELETNVQLEVESMHGTINTLGTNMKEAITQSVQTIDKEMSRLGALITPPREEKLIEPYALQSQHQEQFRLMETKYDAVIKSLIHLNKRIDDFSVDNVVAKINMQIRNVRDEHLQSLMMDLRKLREFIGMTDAAGNVRPPEQPLMPGSRLSLIDMKQEVEALRLSLHRMNQAWGQRADDMGHRLDKMEMRS